MTEVHDNTPPCGNCGLALHVRGCTAEKCSAPSGLYPERNAMHKNMAPPELYPCCGGRGWFEDGRGERYCDCKAGQERRRTDG